MNRWGFQPRSRQQDERPITRSQIDYSAGLWEEKPGSPVPHNSVTKLENLRNFGSSLKSRGGSLQASAINYPSLVTGLHGSSTISGTTRTITLTSGGDSGGVCEVGAWFVFDNGLHERITTRTSATSLQTRTYKSAVATGDSTFSAGWAHGAINGRWFNRKYRINILHIGTGLYYSDALVTTSWVAFVRNSVDTIPNSPSRFADLDDWTIIGSQDKLFKIDLKGGQRLYYRINTRPPSVKLVPSTAINDVADPYGNRYVFTMSRLSGSGNTRDRNTAGVIIEEESPPIIWDNGDWADYWQTYQLSTGATTATDVYNIVNELFCPVNPLDESTVQEHWTHYSLYRTDEMHPTAPGDLKTDSTNRQVLYWVADIPIVKAFVGTITSASGVLTLTLTDASAGAFVRGDRGSWLTYYNGTNTYNYLIQDWISSTVVTVTLASGSPTYPLVGAFAIGVDYVTGSTHSTRYSNLRGCTQSGTTVTLVWGAAYAASDIGKTIYWCDGTSCVVTDYNASYGTVTVDKSLVHATYGSPIYTACVMTAYSRKYYDCLSATDLRESHAGWLLQNRGWREIPAGNVLAISHGKLIAGNVGDLVLYYGSVAEALESYTYYAGYYHPGYQYLNLKDQLQNIAVQGDNLTIWMQSRMQGCQLNADAISEIPEILKSINIIPLIYDISETTGLIHPNAMAMNDKRVVGFIDNLLQWRTFTGTSLSVDLGANHIGEALKKMMSVFNVTWDYINGFTIHGTLGR